MSIFKNKGGMSLIEVVVAILILGIITVPLVNFFLTGNVFTAIAHHDLTALHLAQEKLEEIKSKPYREVVSEPADPGAPPLTISDRYGGAYSYKITVREDDNAKTVTVTILFKDRDQVKEVSLTTEKIKR